MPPRISGNTSPTHLPVHDSRHRGQQATAPAEDDAPAAVAEASTARPTPRANPLQQSHTEIDAMLDTPPGQLEHRAPDATAMVSATPGLIAAGRGAVAPAGAAALTPAQQAQRGWMLQHGCSRTEFERATTGAGLRYVPNASRGVTLGMPNDRDGHLLALCQHEDTSISEMLPVIKAKPPGADDTAAEERFFLIGYGNAVVDVRAALAGRLAPAAGGDPMETAFRTQLKAQCGASPYTARRNYEESDTVIMPKPLNATPMPRRETWANSENYMSKGFGGHPDVNGRPSVFQRGYVDYNAIENRIVVFLVDRDKHSATHATQDRKGKRRAAAQNLEGSVLAEIHGISHIESFGPSGASTVPLGTLKSFLSGRGGGTGEEVNHLRITTEDGAKHDMRYTDDGLTMALFGRNVPSAQLMRPLDGAQISLYSYMGRNTGPAGSPHGYSNPELMTVAGPVPVAPLLVNRDSAPEHLKAAGRTLAQVIDLRPTIGTPGTRLSAALNATLEAVLIGSVVMGMTAALEASKKLNDGPFMDGADDFSGAGAGKVTPRQMALAAALIVIAQKGITQAYAAARHFLPNIVKSRDSAGGRLLNDGVLSFTGEYGRLLANYVIQEHIAQVPRGGKTDIGMLSAAALTMTGIDAIKGAAGLGSNHPVTEGVLRGVRFLVGDVPFRSISAALNAGAGSMAFNNFMEAAISRTIVRGVDKTVLPLIGGVLRHFDLLGINDLAYADQGALALRGASSTRASPNARTGLARAIDVLEDLGRYSHTNAERLFKKAGRQIQQDDVEHLGAFTKVAHMLREADKAANRWFVLPKDTDQTELQAVTAAGGFHALDEDGQVAHLDAVRQRFDNMIAASDMAADAARASGFLIGNHESEIPAPMRKRTDAIEANLQSEEARALAAGGAGAEGEALYPARPPRDYSGPLVAGARQSRVPGARSDRVPTQATTFSSHPARFIADVHRKMEKQPGMPTAVDQSDGRYQALDKTTLAAIRIATEKYTEESGFFHYLLRWAQTGQPHFTEVVPGLLLETTMMNKRDNVHGDMKNQISPLDPLYVNLGALHAAKFPDIVYRAVVTDAPYLADAEKANQTVTTGERVALTEIMSTTSTKPLAASFLSALGYGAAAQERRLRLVMETDSAVNIATHTDLMQAETISMPGGIFKVVKIVNEPHAPEGATGDNQGMTVYLQRVNTYALEQRFRSFLDRHGAGGGERTAFADGDLMVEPGTGHFYAYDAASDKLRFVNSSKNYFLGTDLDTDPAVPAVWRYPYTSPKAKRGILDALNHARLEGHPIKSFLNDAVRNVHHEEDMRKGGYYAPGNAVKAQDDAALAQTKQAAQTAIDHLQGMQADQPIPALQVDGHREAFRGELLARLLSSAARQAVTLVEVDGAGRPVLDSNGRPRVTARLGTTWDGVDMQYDTKRPARMIGMGPAGFYIMETVGSEPVCAQVRISGDGLTPGNLLHALMASPGQAYTKPLYRLGGAGVELIDPPAAGKPDNAAALLGKLQRYVDDADTTLLSWLSTQAGGAAYPRKARFETVDD